MYEHLHNNKLTIKSNSGIKIRCNGADIFGNIKTLSGVFIYAPVDGKDEVVTLELEFSLHLPGPLLSSSGVKLPRTMTSQETLSALNKDILGDEETADLTLRCGDKTFRVHKSFLCSR